MENSTVIPAGYMERADGTLVPVANIRQIDLERDALVKEIITSAQYLAATISAFKVRTMADIGAFVELSAEKYNAKVGGQKGNITLMSFDGRFKIQRAIDEYQIFDERLQAAKSLIDECITEWAAGSRPELHTLINDAFQVDKQGRINVNRILSLRRLDISDGRWKQAMSAIGDSLQVVGSKAYIRIYERQADGGYKPMPLGVAA